MRRVWIAEAATGRYGSHEQGAEKGYHGRQMRVPRPTSFASLPLVASLALFGCGASSADAQPSDGGGDAGTDVVVTGDPADLLDEPISCAFDCKDECEPKGYQCPALAAWNTIPHAASCGSFDGKFPAVSGKCTAATPTGAAAKKTGIDPDDPTTTILPTGQRAKPSGKASVFTDYKGQFPTNVVTIPGSNLAIVVDGGIQEQSVRLVDTDAIGGAGDPVLGREKFTGTTSVNYGAVVLGAAGGTARVYVSGGADGVVYAFTVDIAGKKLTRNTDGDIKIGTPSGAPASGGGLAGNYYLSGLAASPDGKKLFVATGNASATKTPIFVVDSDPTSATFKKVTSTFVVGARELFTLWVHPADTEGKTLFVSVWDGARVEVWSTTDGKQIASIDVGKNPQAFTILGTRYLAVVDSDGDDITIIDTLTSPPAKVGSTPIDPRGSGARHGYAPSGLAWDDAGKRLYVTLAGLNAVTAFDVTLPASGPPVLAPAGSLGTDWWPTAVALRDDGALVVVNGKGKGTGANPIPFKPSQGNDTELMRGSIQLVPKPDAATLTAGTAALEAATNLGALPGATKVDCGGNPYDFPVPETNTAAASTQIKHVIFVVKENKTFDGVFGDLPGLDGDPKLVMAPEQMEDVFGNQRKLAKAFTVFDNYYTSAEQSIQGHIWTSYGRTMEFTERSWLVTWGRGYRSPPPQGILPVGKPVEGSVFNWLQREKVLFDDMGEIIGAADDDGSTPKNAGYDSLYPGVLYAMDKPDTEKSCYIVARARATCDLKSFTYAIQPNDHTSGGAAGKPTPATYIAVGDEALGILIDGLSRSPAWGETLVIVTMDDPQDGGDHVDAHRTPFFLVGPWVKRNYVAKGHYDTSSIHKLLAHLFAKPYMNEEVARAALPLEAFTSTPDFTPYDRLLRTEPLGCNPNGTKMSTTAAMSGWDLSQPDEAPGIGRQVWEYFHGGAPAPEIVGRDDDDD